MSDNQEALLGYDGSPQPHEPPKEKMCLKVFVLVLFLAAILIGPNLIRPKQDPPYTYLTCKLTKAGDCDGQPFISNGFNHPTFHTVIARGQFNPLNERIGWHTLDIATFQPASDATQAIALGYLEGYLTFKQINDSLLNDNATRFNSRPDDARQQLAKFFETREKFLSTFDKDDTPYGRAVQLTNKMQIGLSRGYEDHSHESGEPVLFDLAIWSQRAEFGDIFNTIYQSSTRNCWDMTQQQLDDLMGDEHCSSISKTTIDVSDIATCRKVGKKIDQLTTNTPTQTKNNKDTKTSPLRRHTVKLNEDVECSVDYLVDFAVAHDTWTGFVDMGIRIVKKYSTEFRLYTELHPQQPERRNERIDPKLEKKTKIEPWVITLTGYAGMLTSYDDYYVLSSPSQQLIVTETTNTNCNKELWLRNSPESISTTQRTIIASLLAINGMDWVTQFAKHNSGTYNNQWMVLDGRLFSQDDIEFEIKPFENNKEVNDVVKMVMDSDHDIVTKSANKMFYSQIIKTRYPAGFYVIAEQAPGLVIIKDVTDVVNTKTYWASYNRPYLPEIYKEMGFDKATEAMGDYYSFDKYARAQVMARDLPIKPFPSVIDIQDEYPVQPTTTTYDLMRYMRFNDFQNDPLSRNCAIYAIASRYDLIPPEGCGKPLAKPNARGQIDVKIGTVLTTRHNYIESLDKVGINNPLLNEKASVVDWKQGVLKLDNSVKHQNALFWIISGPTTDQGHKPFTWDDPRWVNFTHYGHPTHFDFDWVQLIH